MTYAKTTPTSSLRPSPQPFTPNMTQKLATPFSQAKPYTPRSLTSTERLSNLYTINYINACEIIYGSDGMISQGGYESVDLMFKKIDLNGKKVLDIGCGLGGMDTYLASKYNVEIVGVDKEVYMTNEADKLLKERGGSLKGRVSFGCLKKPTSLEEFPDNTFDIVTSKETLYHVPTHEKLAFVQEMFRVLKPGGKIVTADWNSSKSELGDTLKRAIRVDGFCHFITAQDFMKILSKARFSDITYEDVSDDHIDYTERDILRIGTKAEAITNKTNLQTLEHVKVSWDLFQKAVRSRELKASVFVGTKPNL